MLPAHDERAHNSHGGSETDGRQMSARETAEHEAAVVATGRQMSARETAEHEAAVVATGNDRMPRLLPH
jgi:hypothetical protein